jgi:hypothetical protein
MRSKRPQTRLKVEENSEKSGGFNAFVAKIADIAFPVSNWHPGGLGLKPVA